MHPAYFATVFIAPETIENYPDEFAIVTAYATTGESWAESENRGADERFAAILEGEGVWAKRIIGSSPDLQHQEPGWAAEVDMSRARELGAQFKQDAIYWVSGDLLFVTECAPEAKLELVGEFRRRVRFAA
jgi:hypothetical protein